MLTFEDIKNNETVRALITQADLSLAALGYTEHSFAHVGIVANEAKIILSFLGYSEREQFLSQVAGYLHDIGNVVNRVNHSQSGAIMAYNILSGMNMSPSDIAVVVSAIGNHDEGTGIPVDAVSAALILADKSDVRRTRVRNTDTRSFDIHDRVNYSVIKSTLEINDEKSIITLNLLVDTEYSSIMDYFEIFLDRMLLCRRAAEVLNLRFKLKINEQSLI